MSEMREKECWILIIDDHVDTVRLLSNMLKDMGRIFFATSGDMGVQKARELLPDLILLDIEMPDVNGYEVCRVLKNNVITQGSSVIFVTAHTTSDKEVAALEAGAVDFITKPLNPPVVRARIQAHLRLHRQSTIMAKLANCDGLTGLYNRRYFDGKLEKEFQRHRRQKMPLGLAFIDIDYFKVYNDGYGHVEGDICLEKVANALQSATRRPDEVVARYGGEEFVVILPYATAEDVKKYGDWICNRIQELDIAHAYSEIASNVTISAGVFSKVPDEYDVAQLWIKAADDALYQAKSSGRNCAKLAASW